MTDAAPEVRASRATGDRSLLRALFYPPNPVWLREMRQTIRLTRTPIILATVTTITALLICSVGGIAGASTAPASVGAALFHVFFSLAFAVVAWVGPGVAAMTIASEKSGRTWEALLLTGLGTRSIARGKFMAAVSYIGMYIVMLAPVGALPFLFGGVTATEVLLAFLLLLLFCALSVGFGLAMSSAMSSPGLAVVITLPIAVALSVIIYVAFGVGLSFAAHERWPNVLSGGPIWLPTAMVRAPFGFEYAVYLLLLPVGLCALLAWFFYETTVSNITDHSEDRSFGLKRWVLVATPAFSAMAIAPITLNHDDRWIVALAGLGGLFGFLVLVLFLFSAEDLEPSRRVRVRWERAGTGRLRRFLGPGIANTAVLLLLMATLSIGAITAAGWTLELADANPDAKRRALSVVVAGGYALAFCTFLCGFATWVRARSSSGTAPRLLLLLALFVAFVGPWIAMAIAGVLTSKMRDALLLAAPSPAFVLTMLEALGKSTPNARATLTAGATAATLWAAAGALLLLLGARRAKAAARFAREARERLETANTPAAPARHS